MKKKIVTTPIIWYVIGSVILAGLLIAWICLETCGPDSHGLSIAVDAIKNMFFALTGSFLVAMLIDVGNTSRDNKMHDKSFKTLQPDIIKLFNVLSRTAFLYSNGFIVEEGGNVKLCNYYEHEFCYVDNGTTEVITLEELSRFKSVMKNSIGKMKETSHYFYLHDSIKNLIEEILVTDFSILSNLNEKKINVALFPSFAEDVNKLNLISEKLGTLLDVKREYKFLTREESDDYRKRRSEEAEKYKTLLASIGAKGKIYKGGERKY